MIKSSETSFHGPLGIGRDCSLPYGLCLGIVKNQTESLHRETAVAYSRNWLPGPRGRPSPSLLERALSEQAGGPNVVYKSIDPSLFSLRLRPPPSLPCSRSARDPRPCLGLHPRTPPLVALVAIPRPCLVWPFCASAVSKSPLHYASSIVGLILSPHLGI